MFESDDFDQVLSQFDFPDVCTRIQSTTVPEIGESNSIKITQDSSEINVRISLSSPKKYINENNDVYSALNDIENNNDNVQDICSLPQSKNVKSTNVANTETVRVVSPKHAKRKLINTFFDPKSKRKFPGPAGLLTGNLEGAKDETICHMELLSQDMEFTQNNLQRDLFESPLWMRMLEDLKSWSLCEIDPIKVIKQQALAGHLRPRKAQTVTAFIETVDRSAIDPLIILRDTTGNIKCTLHRDAWSTFSAYIVSEYCALVLLKPTVLTTGSAFKKHYLNITLSNIYAIYSSAVLNEDENPLPDGYTRISEDDFTVIKTEISPHSFGSSIANSEPIDANNLLDGLDNIFSDDLF